MPKCVVVDPNFDWQGEPNRQFVPWDHTILYETHVKGFTKRHPKVPESAARHLCRPRHRGGRSTTSSRSASPRSSCCRCTPSSTTAICSRRGLPIIGATTRIGFFAPDPRYAADVANSLREFKEMVARFHDAGLEVILDVVYNHTAEGNERGPTLSFKGIDNASYYRLLPDQKRYYINDTGTGNTVNLSHPRVIQMVTDSLRYWVQEMHVDGFRFDLGTILAREPNGFDEQSGFLKACRPGPGARHRQADRRALGLRPRRLPGRRLPAGLGGVERQVPRHGARLSGAARRPPRRSRRGSARRATCSTTSGRRAWASRELHHRA